MAITSHQLLERLAKGRTKQMIATEFRTTEDAIQNAIDTQVGVMGCRTSEQAVAQFIAGRIKEALPLPLRSQVESLMTRQIKGRSK